MGFDERVVDWVDDLRSPTATTVLRAATHLADYWVATVVVAVVATLLVLRHHRGAALAVAASSFGAMVVTEVLKEVIGRERPPVASHLVHAAGHAFPSGHSSQSVACYGGLALVAFLVSSHPGVRAAAVVGAAFVAVLVGLSRIYLRVHWPTDVLSGWALGLLWLLVVTVVAVRLRALDRPAGWWGRRSDGSASATPAAAGPP